MAVDNPQQSLEPPADTDLQLRRIISEVARLLTASETSTLSPGTAHILPAQIS